MLGSCNSNLTFRLKLRMIQARLTERQQLKLLGVTEDLESPSGSKRASAARKSDEDDKPPPGSKGISPRPRAAAAVAAESKTSPMAGAVEDSRPPKKRF